jgi:peptide/nickel transport system permease protein
MNAEQEFRLSRPRPRRLAAGITIVGAFYLAALFAEVLAPYPFDQQARGEPSAPASTIRFRGADGTFHLRPFIYRTRLRNALTLEYEEDTTKTYPLGLFTQGAPYAFLGLIPARTHLFGVLSDEQDAPRVRLLGTDALGRDRFSRLLYALRFSLTVSPLGGVLACLIGVLIGIVSGYSAKLIDGVLMGTADSLMALPTLILILAARAAFPLELPPSRAAVLLIAIFALTGWAEMARLSRGLVVSVRGREFVLAARALGLTELRILFRHILPNIARPVFTQAALLLPAFLLAEVALSYLGVGLQEPQPSLGNMLASANDLTQLMARPLLLLSPAAAVFLFVFGVRLVGDGLKAREHDHK